MSETVKTLVESLLLIGAISGAFVWFGIVAGRNEDREAELSRDTASDRKGGVRNYDETVKQGPSPSGRGWPKAG